MQLASILSNILIIIIKKVTYGAYALDKLMLFQGSAKKACKGVEMVPALSGACTVLPGLTN